MRWVLYKMKGLVRSAKEDPNQRLKYQLWHQPVPHEDMPGCLKSVWDPARLEEMLSDPDTRAALEK